MELEDDTIDSMLSAGDTNTVFVRGNTFGKKIEQTVATRMGNAQGVAFQRYHARTNDSEENDDESGHNNVSTTLSDDDSNLEEQFVPHSYASRLQFSDPAPSEESTLEWDHDIVSASDYDDDESDADTTSDDEEDDDQVSSSSSFSSDYYSKSSRARAGAPSTPPLLEISAPPQRERTPLHQHEDAASKCSFVPVRRTSPCSAAKAQLSLHTNPSAFIWNAPPLKTSSSNTKTASSSATNQGAQWVFPSQGTRSAVVEDNNTLVQAPCTAMPIAQPIQATMSIDQPPMALPKPQSRTFRWLRSVLRLQKKRTPLEEAALAASQAAEAATRASQAAELAAQAATRAAEAAVKAAEAVAAQQQQLNTPAPRPRLGPSDRGSRRNFRRRLGRM